MTRSNWTAYLLSRVGIDVYVYGGNGEPIVDLFPVLCAKEGNNITNVNRVLNLLYKRIMAGIEMDRIRGVDCSGLGVKKLLEEKIIPSDMTANGIYEYIVGTDKKPAHGKKIKLSEVREGDFLFQGSESNKHHIGYAIDEVYAVESKNHDEGVVKTKISERGWTHAARPDWYEEEKYVLTRELSYQNPMMRGEDVEKVQERLNELGYNCGDADGVFGKKTEIASKNFKHDNGLKCETGTVGKKTAEKLGFEWRPMQ